MLFNSFQFAIFFPIVTALYFLIAPRANARGTASPARIGRLGATRAQNLLLLVASCYFYMACIPVYVAVLWALILIDYTAGRLIERAAGSARRGWLIGSLIANLGVLAVFKYANFLNDQVAALARLIHWNYSIEGLRLLLPIGLSFHTFQSMSYTIEVYRGAQAAERSLLKYALYVMFYPQLVAGPIERPQRLLPQFDQPHAFDYARVTDGLKLMAWGLFQKVAIADRLAVIVNHVYARPTDTAGLPLLIATVCFAVQIVCDFAGYSDMALGIAQVMGFRLMENFRRPYFATSVADFWRRWHISLSSWFRDYVYIPLGGNRVGPWRWARNIVITFLLSGLWHGANWTFVAWGALHAGYLLASRATSTLRARLVQATGLAQWPRLHRAMQTGMTFGLVCIAWVFFRARTLHEAGYILTHLLPARAQLAWLSDPVTALGVTKKELLGTALTVGVLVIVQAFQARGRIRPWLSLQPLWLRWAAYYGLAWGILLCGMFTESRFIYFQF